MLRTRSIQGMPKLTRPHQDGYENGAWYLFVTDVCPVLELSTEIRFVHFRWPSPLTYVHDIVGHWRDYNFVVICQHLLYFWGQTRTHQLANYH
jgi:hypothetical protein